MKNWLLATRPKTLFASLSPVILGLSLSRLFILKLDYIVAALTILCAILMQIASNLANDYLDFKTGIDTHERIGPVRVTHAGLISEQKMRRALILVLIAALTLGSHLMYIGGPIIVIIGILSLYFAYGYTGGPFPLSKNGLGEIAAFIFFGPIAVFGTFYLQTHSINYLPFLIGIGPGAISATILAINNLRDIKSDRLSNKLTLAVKFGDFFQRKLCISLIFFSAFLIVFISLYYKYHLLLTVSVTPLFFNSTWTQILNGPITKDLNHALAKTAQFLLIYCLISSLSLIYYWI